MTYVPTLTQRSLRRVAQSIPLQVAQEPRQNQFLVIGCGDELRGDDAVGPLVAMTIASWQLSSASSIAVSQLTPALIAKLAKTDYVIFVESCCEDDRVRTTQVCPLIVNNSLSETINIESGCCSPQALISLTKRVYGDCPQAWIIQVPTENFKFTRNLSSTAKTGMDWALQAINQFLRTYA